MGVCEAAPQSASEGKGSGRKPRCSWGPAITQTSWAPSILPYAVVSFYMFRDTRPALHCQFIFLCSLPDAVAGVTKRQEGATVQVEMTKPNLFCNRVIGSNGQLTPTIHSAGTTGGGGQLGHLEAHNILHEEVARGFSHLLELLQQAQEGCGSAIRRVLLEACHASFDEGTPTH
eukprot:SM000199S05424  [mRNA]  locus=s199:87551:90083:+ [translate_table: standard]